MWIINAIYSLHASPGNSKDEFVKVRQVKTRYIIETA